MSIGNLITKGLSKLYQTLITKGLGTIEEIREIIRKVTGSIVTFFTTIDLTLKGIKAKRFKLSYLLSGIKKIAFIKKFILRSIIPLSRKYKLRGKKKYDLVKSYIIKSILRRGIRESRDLRGKKQIELLRDLTLLGQEGREVLNELLLRGDKARYIEDERQLMMDKLDFILDTRTLVGSKVIQVDKGQPIRAKRDLIKILAVLDLV